MSQLCCRRVSTLTNASFAAKITVRIICSQFMRELEIRNGNSNVFGAASVSVVVDGSKDLCITRVEFQCAPSSP